MISSKTYVFEDRNLQKHMFSKDILTSSGAHPKATIRPIQSELDLLVHEIRLPSTSASNRPLLTHPSLEERTISGR